LIRYWGKSGTGDQTVIMCPVIEITVYELGYLTNTDCSLTLSSDCNNSNLAFVLSNVGVMMKAYSEEYWWRNSSLRCKLIPPISGLRISSSDFHQTLTWLWYYWTQEFSDLLINQIIFKLQFFLTILSNKNTYFNHGFTLVKEKLETLLVD